MLKKSGAMVFSQHKKLYGITSLVVLGCFTQNVFADTAFEPQIEYALSGTDPIGIILGDFNNDGIDDIATSLADGTAGGSISILFGTSAGTFTDHLQMPITNGNGDGYVPAGLAGGDFNGDGRLDLAVTAGGSNLADVHVYLNTASGAVGFSYSTTVVSGGIPAVAVVAEDFDKDGNLDLAVGNNVATTGAGVSVFVGNGDGTFSVAQNIDSTNAVGVTDIIAVDIDKDNDFDLVMPRLVLHNDGNGGFDVNNPLERQGSPLHIVSVDLNQDTWVDIVLSGEGGMGTYTNDQLGIFSAVDRGFEDGPLRGHTAGDFNLDGNVDVALAREDTDDLRIFLGDGAGVLARDTPLLFPVGDEPQNIVSGDFNNDGMLDIAISNRNAGSPTVSVLLQHDPNAPPNELPVANPGGPYNGTVDVAVQFDGSASSDPDGSIASYSWDFGNGTSGTGATPSATYSEAGTFDVTLTVTDDAGATNSMSTTVEVIAAANQLPVADPGGPYNGTVDVAVQFDGSASSDPDGSIASYSWDFGNGTSGTGATPSATYTEAGTFNVTLMVTDDVGETNSVSTTVIVASAANQSPVANPGGPYNGTVGVTVQFNGSGSSDPDGSIASYSWDFGNGTNGTGAAPSITYTEAGTFNVTLTVTDNAGATNSVNTTVVIVAAANQQPVANPGGPYSGTAGIAVQFNGATSSDPDGTIASYSWDFGNGTTGAGATPSTTYTEAGTFNVILTVTDNAGATNSASTTVVIGAVVVNQQPVADSGGPYSGTVGVVVTFDGSSSSDPDGTIVSYSWDFGNGITGTGTTPGNTYAEEGTFDVTLTVTDNVGATNSMSTTVDIVASGNQLPIANPGGPYKGSVDKILLFNGFFSSDPDGKIVSYSWDFGDGGVGEGISPIYTYTEEGTYDVTLTVTDNAGGTNTASTTIEVGEAGGGAFGPFAGLALLMMMMGLRARRHSNDEHDSSNDVDH
ncbi:MAG: PKD domain-containing protein [Gammaproteobacteria bacterium]|nr:PKD domain-containing protein [Gammaproteobacteria bacterium]